MYVGLCYLTLCQLMTYNFPFSHPVLQIPHIFFFTSYHWTLTIPFFHIHPEESMIGSPHPHPTPPSKMIFFCVLWSSSHLTYFCSPPLPNILCVQTQASNCTDLRCLAIVKKRSTDHALKKNIKKC